MKGDKTLTSGNVARWEFVDGATRAGVQSTFRTPPTDDDLREFIEFANGLAGRGATPASVFVGVGPDGARAAKAAFENLLGRSAN